jgi:hypothetical protein
MGQRVTAPSSDPIDEALAALSVGIGTIMEDHVDAAVTRLPNAHAERLARFESLGQAGQDIATLAGAAKALLRRY